MFGIKTYDLVIKSDSGSYPQKINQLVQITDTLPTADLTLGYDYKNEEFIKRPELYSRIRDLVNPFNILPAVDKGLDEQQSFEYYIAHHLIQAEDNIKNDKFDGNHVLLFKNKEGTQKDTVTDFAKWEPADYLTHLHKNTLSSRDKLRRAVEKRDQKFFDVIPEPKEIHRLEFMQDVDRLRYRPLIALCLNETDEYNPFSGAIQHVRRRHLVIKDDKGNEVPELNRSEKDVVQQIASSTLNDDEISNFKEAFTNLSQTDSATSMFYQNIDYNRINKADLITSYPKTANVYDPLEEQKLHENMVKSLKTAIDYQAENGVFIMKCANIQTILTQELIYLMSQYYKKIKIVRPSTVSSIDNTRFVVGIGFIPIKKLERASLNDFTEIINKLNQDQTPFRLFQLQRSTEFKDFYKSIIQANLDIGASQKSALRSIKNYEITPYAGYIVEEVQPSSHQYLHYLYEKVEKKPKKDPTADESKPEYYNRNIGVYHPVHQKYINIRSDLGQQLKRLLETQRKVLPKWFKTMRMMEQYDMESPFSKDVEKPQQPDDQLTATETASI